MLKVIFNEQSLELDFEGLLEKLSFVKKRIVIPYRGVTRVKERVDDLVVQHREMRTPGGQN